MVVTLCGRSHSNRMASTGKNNVLEVRYSFALGARLRKLRHQLGLSQEEVAHRAGIATYTYQKFENGDSKPGTHMNPTLHTLIALSHVLNTSLPELLDFKELEAPSFAATADKVDSTDLRADSEA